MTPATAPGRAPGSPTPARPVPLARPATARTGADAWQITRDLEPVATTATTPPTMTPATAPGRAPGSPTPARPVPPARPATARTEVDATGATHWLARAATTATTTRPTTCVMALAGAPATSPFAAMASWNRARPAMGARAAVQPAQPCQMEPSAASPPSLSATCPSAKAAHAAAGRTTASSMSTAASSGASPGKCSVPDPGHDGSLVGTRPSGP